MTKLQNNWVLISYETYWIFVFTFRQHNVQSPLHTAISKNKYACAELLLKYGADVSKATLSFFFGMGYFSRKKFAFHYLLYFPLYMPPLHKSWGIRQFSLDKGSTINHLVGCVADFREQFFPGDSPNQIFIFVKLWEHNFFLEALWTDFFFFNKPYEQFFCSFCPAPPDD